MARNTQQDAPVKITAREAFDALPATEGSPAQEFVQQSIADAVDLLDVKSDLLARLQQSRDFLDYAVKSGQATAEQAAWVTAYLPKRTKSRNGDGSEEE